MTTTDAPPRKLRLEEAKVANNSVVETALPLTIRTNPQQWSYALTCRIPALAPELDAEAVRVSIRATVHEGVLGALLVTPDQSPASTQASADATQPGTDATLSVIGHRRLEPLTLVLRNETQSDRPCRFTVHRVDVRAETDVQSAALADVLTPDRRRVDLGVVRSMLGQAPGTAGFQLDCVPVEDIHARLGLSQLITYPAASLRKPFELWRMETDDAPILRYVYRHFRPARHLEFGTWQGQGACYCLEESAATVWTLNLPFGERQPDGTPAYYATLPQAQAPAGAKPLEEGGLTFQTDAGMFIGRLYRERGFGHRVCQIYCDSRDWDISNYPPRFFDTALIDGGHTEDVVWSDTRKALDLVRSGGLVLWHDFCPAPGVLRTSAASAGVVSAIARHAAEIRSRLTDLFWIQPSFLLVGVRGR